MCSPNNTHLESVQYCLSAKIAFIYVEKPAIGVEEYFRKRWTSEFKPFVQVGYQWMYDKSLQLIKSAINNKYGHLHKIDIFVGHGLGYKPEFVNSWRSSDSNVLQTWVAIRQLSFKY